MWDIVNIKKTKLKNIYAFILFHFIDNLFNWPSFVVIFINAFYFSGYKSSIGHGRQFE